MMSRASCIDGLGMRPANPPIILKRVARIGVADVRSFGLMWEDRKQLLMHLGYSAQVSIVAR
jgi:hypothetical protein